jgi:hypothetical protein
MLTRLQAREEKEKGGVERRRGVRRSNQLTALFSVPDKAAIVKREEHLLCRPNMHNESEQTNMRGNRL